MPFFLRAKRLDIATGQTPKILLNAQEAERFSIRAGDRVTVRTGGRKTIATVDTTSRGVPPGSLGLYREVARELRARDRAIVSLALQARPLSLVAIRKKLQGQRLNEREFAAIVHDTVSGALDPVQLTYFVAASFFRPYTDDELYALTKAMAENGSMLTFSGSVVDKHSIGGLSGNRTTMVVVPMVIAAGLTIPKTSSRAITSPSGTADTMEVLAPVEKTATEIRAIVHRAHGCIVWGGGLDLAPADDRFIQVSSPLGMEPYPKMIVSILAKKVAMGVRTLVIDLPYGITTKVPGRATARSLARRFTVIGNRFGIRTKVVLLEAREPVGRGVGPALEARDVVRVLQQKPSRPHDLERKSLLLAGTLFELAGKSPRGKGARYAAALLRSGAAWRAMQGVIAAQGGNPLVDADALTVKAKTHRVYATRSGTVSLVDNRVIDELCRMLGAPKEKLAGIFLHRRLNDRVKPGWKLFTLYAPSDDRLQLALEALRRMAVFRFTR